jgi:hypothetical protein
VRVTFFGQEAQTLVGLSAARLVAAEQDFWWYEVLFLEVNMRAILLFSQGIHLVLWWICGF